MPVSSLADDLVRIHRVFSRALRVTVETTTQYLDEPPVPDAVPGFAMYVETMFRALRAHHESEGVVIWPFVRACGVPAPYETLSDQHSRIAGLVESAGSALHAGNMPVLRSITKELEDLWLSHYPLEENAFGPAVWPGPLTAAQVAELEERVARHQEEQMHTSPGSIQIAIPFVLYNLEPEDRAMWAAQLPKEVIVDLVPGPWLSQWLPMRPFLLE